MGVFSRDEQRAARRVAYVLLALCRLKAKFHYASWFGAGSEPVRSRLGASLKLVRSWFDPNSVMELDFEPASNQLRTS